MDAIKLAKPARPPTEILNRFRAAVLLCLLVLAGAARAAEGQSLEYQVKAAFLLNFTKFVEWPAAAFPAESSPISICILGEDPFRRILDQVVDGEFVNAHKVVVHRIRQLPTPGACHVLFVDNSEKDIPGVLASLGPGILTVGEGDSFLQHGGIIAFVIDSRRVRFDINQTAAAKAELKMNAKLLSVARSVER